MEIQFLETKLTSFESRVLLLASFLQTITMGLHIIVEVKTTQLSSCKN